MAKPAHKATEADRERGAMTPAIFAQMGAARSIFTQSGNYFPFGNSYIVNNR